jgi:hypothetical protein
MNTTHDPLSERITEWAAQTNESPSPQLGSQGFALYEIVKRIGPPAQHFLPTLERHSRSTPSPAAISALADHALQSWIHLLADLDRETANLDPIPRQIEDVFFAVLEALILIEEAGRAEHQIAAQRLFNSIIHDLYIFEPLADFAAELQRPGQGPTQLSDLLCTGIAGLFDGQASLRQQPVEAVEEFVPLDVFLRKSSLAGATWWYVKWAAQRIKMTFTQASRELQLEVCEGESAGPSLALDGWQVRLGHPRQFNTATLTGGMAVLQLPPNTLHFQIKSPASSEWMDLFTQMSSL